MKSLAFLLAAVTAACSTSIVAQNTRIDLNVSNVPDGTKFTISLSATHKDETPFQAVALKDGKAYFAFDSDGTRLYMIATENPHGVMLVMAGKGDRVTVNAAANKMGEWYDFSPIQVKGSFSHTEYDQKMSVRNHLNALYKKYHDDNKDICDKLASLPRESDEMKALMPTDAYKKFADDEGKFFDTVKQSYDQLYIANKDSWWGPFLVLNTMNYIPKETADIFSQFSAEAQNSFYGKILKGLLFPPSLIGKQMPDFSFTDHATGKQTLLYDVLKGKRYVLLDFWASWCGPCRKEIPNFKAQYEIYKDKGFGIVSISADEKEADWLKALDEEKLEWPNGRDADKSISRLYDVKYYPTIYVLDSTGKVVAKDNDARGQQLKALLQELFK